MPPREVDSAACAFSPVELQMAAILVGAGATHASAARAAILLQNGATIAEAHNAVELAIDPVRFDARLLLAEASRQRDLVLVAR